MMSSLSCRIASTVVGVAGFALAGWFLAGWWWVGAAVGAVAVMACQFDHRMGYPMVLATLACSIGAAATGRSWLIVAVVAGVIASIELAAGADRTTVVRPEVTVMPRVVAAVGVAGVVAAAVVAIGEVDGVVGAWSAVVAACVAVVALRLLAR